MPPKKTTKAKAAPKAAAKPKASKRKADGDLPVAKVAKTTTASSSDALSSLITDKDWHDLLMPEFNQPYWKSLEKQVDDAYKTQLVFPPRELIFNAFNTTPLKDVRVVIIGQAHGLCFSVQKGIKVPPSLNRIYKRLNALFGHPIPKHGDLSEWALNGVLMLNATLTVMEGKPNSHAKFGWQQFTDAAIKLLGSKENVVFILWGGFAHKKAKLIDDSKNLVIMDAHPSPMSGSAFNDSTCFREANEYLKSKGRPEVDWRITP